MSKILHQLLSRPHFNYLLIDEEFKIVELSSAIAQFADVPEAVVVGEDIRSGFPELVGIEQELRDVMSGTGETLDYKGIGRPTEPHSPFYLDLYVTQYQDDDFPQAKLILLVEDVTQKMILEQSLVQASNESSLLISALTASRDYIDKVITAISDALFVTNLSGQIKTVNPATERILGYSETELVGQPITMILPREEQKKSRATLYQHLFPYDKSPTDVEVICRKKTGEEVVMTFSCSPVQTNVKGIYDCVYIGRDITLRKKQEEKLREDLAQEREKTQEICQVTQAVGEIADQLLLAVAAVEKSEKSSLPQSLAKLQEIEQAGHALKALLNRLKS